MPVIRLFLLTAVLVTSVSLHTALAAAPSPGDRNFCAACHPLLADTLPEHHPALEDNSPAGCQNCHSRREPAGTLEWLSHFKHYANADLKIACSACHLAETAGSSAHPEQGSGRPPLPPGTAASWEPYLKSWAASGFMDGVHGRARVGCNACHGTPNAFALPETERCLGCHNITDAAAEKDAGGAPDPHRSHLESPDCALCHKAHEPSVNYCNTEGCHNYSFQFPYPNR